MDIQLTDILSLLLALVALVVVLGFSSIDRILKQKIIDRLYADAPFFKAHILLCEFFELLNVQNSHSMPLAAQPKIASDRDKNKRLDQLSLDIQSYIGFNATEKSQRQQVTLLQTDYVRLLNAERLIQKELALMHQNLDNKDRIAAYSQRKSELLNFAGQYQIILADGAVPGYDEIVSRAIKTS